MSSTPIEDSIRHKLTTSLTPSSLHIHNDSSLHSHHAAMRNNTSRETHFRIEITSDAFQGKMQPARHRMVYTLLKEELEREGGVHALSLKTRTGEEETRQGEKEKEEV
ncbi:MAG: hypothetical protein Q9170_006200 [Blastenia crenularia]